MQAIVPNPATRNGQRAVDITDRALRYRATANPPPGPKVCYLCGRQGCRLDIEHVDGKEEHTNPENLAWSCRSCNTTKGNVFKRAGRGRRTRQFNPAAAAGGATNWKQWTAAVMALKGYGSEMSLESAIELVHNTPPEARSEFARELYAHQNRTPHTSHAKRGQAAKVRAAQRRAARRSKTSRSDEVPF